MDATSFPPLPPAPAQDRLTELRDSAEALEGAFLAEMLRHTGLTDPAKGFGGGHGEEAFRGFVADAYGAALAERGGIGLSQAIFEALVAREAGR